MDKMNLTLLTDFYELTMANGYFVSDIKDKQVYFDLFFRKIPDDGGFALFVGLEPIIQYIQNLQFTKEDIEFLRSKHLFDEKFLNYLSTFRFTGDIYAMKEGSVMFANEPILIVRAPIIEAQFIETFLLLTLNHQSLIATKANRIVRAAKDRAVLEMGARRAHGADASILGARAAYIAGAIGTSNTLADKLYQVPSVGTMAHSWIQMFDSELEAFKTYARIYPNNTTFLVDTYDTLKSGVQNAIIAAKEVLWPLGIKKCAIRIDSGDLAYLSNKARKILDEAGLTDCKIVVSNSLDEKTITELLLQDAKIDSFGVGERLITSKSEPVFGGVYKLVAVEENKEILPKIKISDNPAKMTVPHFKKVYRIYDKETRQPQADLLTLHDETIDETQPLEIFDPNFTYKRKTFENYYVEEMLHPIFLQGKLVYDVPSIQEVREYCLDNVEHLWGEMKRFEFPHKYYVDLSEKLWTVREEMILKSRKSYTHS